MNKLQQLLCKDFEDALEILGQGFSSLPEFDIEIEREDLREVLFKTAERLKDNYPYHHPYYLGQMLKPPHPVARLAFFLAMYLNPNNHALDGGRASSAMEKEAVAAIAGMYGWRDFLGHLCGGGTMANLEALWVAGLEKPGKTVVASEFAHYTHGRISEVLGLRFKAIPADARGRMDIGALAEALDEEDVGLVVATMGTTIAGSVDPLEEIVRLRVEHGFRLHADAAYGGYHYLAANLDDFDRESFDLLPEADSIAIDPHKHGLQPYGTGCVLFRDPAVGRHYKHDSPYTYFTSDELHLGEISLECSRAGAAAVALWATMEMFPLEWNGEFAHMLARAREAALRFHGLVEKDPRLRALIKPQLDIVTWAPRMKTASEVSRLSREVFRKCAEQDLHLAVADFPARVVAKIWPDLEMDRESVTCLRACLMKPEHLEWFHRIYAIHNEVVDELMGPKP